jgi:hypothetical protein
VQARANLFGESVDGLCRSRSFGCQADRKADRPGYAISVAAERLDDDRNFHGMPPIHNPIESHSFYFGDDRAGMVLREAVCPAS